MIRKIKENIRLASLIIPVYAQTAADDEAAAARAAAAASAPGAPGGAMTINLNTPDAFAGLANVTVPNIISGLVSFSLIIVSIVFFFILVFGGLKWITSGGDEKKVASARSSVTNALIGLAIVFASWAIISLMQAVFHISIFSFTLPQF